MMKIAVSIFVCLFLFVSTGSAQLMQVDVTIFGMD
jgi:hypothetical protein